MTTDWLRTLRRGPARTARRSSRRRRPSPALAAVAERLEGRVLLSCANNQAPVHPYVTGLGLDPIPANMPGGQRVADLEASDPDGDRVTFRLAPGAPSSDDGYFSVDAETGEIWLERAFGPVGPWSDDGAYLYSITVEAVDECEAASPINVNMSVVRDGWSVREADADPGDGGFTDDPWCPDCTQPGYFSEGNPHPILHFDVDVPYDPPAYFEATLTVWDGATAVTVADARRFDVAAGMAGATGRIAFQFDASAFETGFHSYTLELTAKSSAGATVATRTLDGRVAVANRADGEYGNRWWLPFLDRLDVDEAAATAGGVGLIRGDGTAEFFAGAGGTYASPIGTFETLVRTTDANEATTGYRLESPDGWTKHFDAAGLLTAVTDRNGWAQTFTYTDADSDGLTDELATFTDFAGFTATYAYTNGRLSSSSNGRGVT